MLIDLFGLFGPRRQNGTLVWEVTTEGRIRSSPTVAENILFFGSGDGKVRALNARGAFPFGKIRMKSYHNMKFK